MEDSFVVLVSMGTQNDGITYLMNVGIAGSRHCFMESDIRLEYSVICLAYRLWADGCGFENRYFLGRRCCCMVGIARRHPTLKATRL